MQRVALRYRFRYITEAMMKLTFSGAALVFCAGLLLSQSQQRVDQATVEKWMTELSNWGRWGKEDQLGALNLITPAKRKQAASLVKEGVSVSLARDVEKEKAVDNDSPFQHVMTSTGVKHSIPYCLDTYTVNYH